MNRKQNLFIIGRKRNIPVIVIQVLITIITGKLTYSQKKGKRITRTYNCGSYTKTITYADRSDYKDITQDQYDHLKFILMDINSYFPWLKGKL